MSSCPPHHTAAADTVPPDPACLESDFRWFQLCRVERHRRMGLFSEEPDRGKVIETSNLEEEVYVSPSNVKGVVKFGYQ